ncbi:MAG TPA: hypothetical protein VEW28_09445 [Candidatus Kapabacteria bacterium]|nr:hypothetical protein [Candidatus Kapabacteria bacterium]
MTNTIIRLYLYVALCVAALLAVSSSARAQHGDPLDAMNARASRLIDSTMSMINLRAERFNEELGKVNVVMRNGLATADSDKLRSNLAVIKNFLGYLDVYHSLSSHLKTQVEDSVQAMRMEMPRRYRQTYMQEFLDAFHKDETAFDKYTVTLTKFFASVTDVMQFLLTAHVAIANDKLQFSDKTEYERYQELTDIVNQNNKKQITASAASQKATIEASQEMQEAYGDPNKSH